MVTRQAHHGGLSHSDAYEVVQLNSESYRVRSAALEKDENARTLFKAGHIVLDGMMEGEGHGLDITADATGADGNVVRRGPSELRRRRAMADLERDRCLRSGVIIGRISGHAKPSPPTPTPASCKGSNDWLSDYRGPYHWTGLAPGITCRSRTLARCGAAWRRAAAWGLARAAADRHFEGPTTWTSGSPLWEGPPQSSHSDHHDSVACAGHARTRPYGPTPAAKDIGCDCQATGWRDRWGGHYRDIRKIPQPHVVMTEGYAGWARFANFAVLRPTTSARAG